MAKIQCEDTKVPLFLATAHSFNLTGEDMTVMGLNMLNTTQSIQQILNPPHRWAPQPGAAAIAGPVYKANIAEGMQRHYNRRCPTGVFAGQLAFNYNQYEDQFANAAWPAFFSPNFAPQLGTVLASSTYLHKLPQEYGLTPQGPEVDLRTEVVTTGLPVQTGITTINGAAQEAENRASSTDPYVLTAYGALSINVATQKAHQIFDVVAPILSEDVVPCPRSKITVQRGRRNAQPNPPYVNALGIYQPCCIKSFHHRENFHSMPALTSEQNPPQFHLLAPKTKVKEPYVGLVLPSTGVTYDHPTADSSNVNNAANAASAAVRSSLGNRTSSLPKGEANPKESDGGKNSKKKTKSKGAPEKKGADKPKEEPTFQEPSTELLFDPLWLLFLNNTQETPTLKFAQDKFVGWKTTVGDLSKEQLMKAFETFTAEYKQEKEQLGKAEEEEGQEELSEQLKTMYS